MLKLQIQENDSDNNWWEWWEEAVIIGYKQLSFCKSVQGWGGSEPEQWQWEQTGKDQGRDAECMVETEKA